MDSPQDRAFGLFFSLLTESQERTWRMYKYITIPGKPGSNQFYRILGDSTILQYDMTNLTWRTGCSSWGQPNALLYPVGDYLAAKVIHLRTKDPESFIRLQVWGDMKRFSDQWPSHPAVMHVMRIAKFTVNNELLKDYQ